MSSDSDDAEFESADEGDYPYEDSADNVVQDRSTAHIEECPSKLDLDEKEKEKTKSGHVDASKQYIEDNKDDECENKDELEENEKEFGKPEQYEDLAKETELKIEDKTQLDFKEPSIDESIIVDDDSPVSDGKSCIKDSTTTDSSPVRSKVEDKKTSEPEKSDDIEKASIAAKQINEPEKETKAKPRPGRKKLGKKITSSEGESEKEKPNDNTQKSPARTLRIEKYAQEKKEKEGQERKTKEETQEKEQEDESAAWGWGWKDLSSTLMSTASVGVSTISEHVSHGMDTVLEVVDSIAPSPEELAKRDVQRQKQLDGESSKDSPGEPSESKKENEKEEEQVSVESSKSTPAAKETSGGFGIFSSVWGSASSKVLSTGLNTLEFIGKKTMDVIQDGDPGLMKKRALLKGNTTSLSQTLREAREEAEKQQQQQQEASGDAQSREVKDSFALYFDDFQGLVHLEALELLSRQCDASLHKAMLNLSGGQLADVQDSLASIEEILAVAEQSEGDEDDVDVESANRELEQLLGHIEAMHLSVCTESIQKAWKQTCDWADADSMESASRAFSSSVQIIARLTASSVEVFHRLAQQLLLQQDDSRARVIRGVTEFRRLFCRAVSREAAAFSQTLTRLIGDHSLITDIFLEASSGSEYISNACQLLVPVLQLQVVRD